MTEGAPLAPVPDLVCIKGYIRRRLSRGLAGLIGTSFFEQSEPVYNGCSGGPLIKVPHPLQVLSRPSIEKHWNLLGVYSGCGGLNDPRAPFTYKGYAVREEDFREWRPSMLGGIAFAEEAATGTA